jgi:tRNA (adenine22-N1)-methyltransferase
MLSKRLSMILSMVEPCEVLCDVGSDHGYLALAVLKKGLAKDVIATDLRHKPLQHTQKTFAQANVFEHISYFLSDGIHQVNTSPKTVVICGMGADLILKIIKQDIDRFKIMTQIITQANTRLHYLRKEMASLGFEMTEEKIAKDGFFYIAQSYHYIEKAIELKEEEINFGCLLSVEDDLVYEYLLSEKSTLEFILKNNPKSKKHLYLLSLLKTRLDERVN